ncbi:von Willebrand factor type A domain protein [Botrimarina colliarenosi]|uniref:von Willebrand factor type A domain protein n=2 Tax=Botrimarina colliarenosi TaxID=2528001 RepID=A0A5C6A7C1_9BACT|nr:von Willebrand factor type A domain protein [Botrimarina colliarenosi]
MALAFSTTATRADSPAIVFVVDASGSMGQALDGDRKIDTVKSALTDLVAGLPAETPVGLVAFGHRWKGRCDDVEILTPLLDGTSERAPLLRAIDGLEAHGKSPLEAALLTAADHLLELGDSARVILIADGEATCGADPVETVERLQAAGSHFAIDVVAFGATATATSKLHQIAQVSGGRRLEAEGGGSLLATLRQLVTEATSTGEADRGLAAADRRPGIGKLAVSMPFDAKRSLDSLRVSRITDGKLVKSISTPDSVSNHNLLSGSYRLTAFFATPSYGEPTPSDLGSISIEKGRRVEVELGAIAFYVPALNPDPQMIGLETTPPFPIDAVEVRRSGTGACVVRVLDNDNGEYNFLDKPILPGVYDIALQYKGVEGPTTVAEQVVVRPGRTTTVTIDSGIRFRSLEAPILAWRLLRHTESIADATEDGPTPPVGRQLALEVRTTTDIGNRLWLPYLVRPGVFDIEVTLPGREGPLLIAEEVTIAPGQILPFDCGI